MLRRNLWIMSGLVNGAIRIVCDIVIQPDGDDQLDDDNQPDGDDNYNESTVSDSVPITQSKSCWMNARESKIL